MSPERRFLGLEHQVALILASPSSRSFVRNSGKIVA